MRAETLYLKSFKLVHKYQALLDLNHIDHELFMDLVHEIIAYKLQYGKMPRLMEFVGFLQKYTSFTPKFFEDRKNCENEDVVLIEELELEEIQLYLPNDREIVDKVKKFLSQSRI
jgi:hypothetical protein